MKEFNLIILSNETEGDILLWEKACKANPNANYRVVNLTKNLWFEELNKEPFDYLLAKPGGLSASYKQLYDERVYILSKVLKLKIFPSADEIFIYENKRFFSFWLKANKIPHPKTDVFYNIIEAQHFLSNNNGTLVAKTNIGASGSGVKILKSSAEKADYISQAFKGKGSPQRVGPNFEKGGIIKRGMHYIFNPGEIRKKLKKYKTVRSDPQKGFIIFQEYIPHDFEWRVVRIGDSFFAHKKLLKKGKASGSLLKGYDNPPLGLFDFVKAITDKYKFYSQAVDIFETNEGDYLVNEMQCIFGQSDPYQMLVNGKPGRYLSKNGKWVFEEGMFNQNESYNLRLEHVINELQTFKR